MTVGIARIADGEPAERKRRDGRALLLKGARQLLAEKGYAGMELRDVAERGKAPRGSIYHHFPGGKVQLAREAAELEGATIRDLIERSLEERGLKETLPSSATSSAAASPTTRSGSVALSPRSPWPGPRTPSWPRSRPPPSRAGNGRSPPPCATKASSQGRRDLRRPRRLDGRGRPAARSRRRQPGAARLGDRRASDMRWTACSKARPAG